MSVFRCDVPGVQRAYDTEAEAVAMAEELVRKGAKFVVVWEQGLVEEVLPEATGRPLRRAGLVRGLLGRGNDDEARSA